MRLDDKEIMLLWEQEVAGSNPATPTLENQRLALFCVSLFRFKDTPKFTHYFSYCKLHCCF